ncbi:KAP family NTPase [Citrobacter portucalensis]|uniref:P-loop NTPase fold protein n=1 Tax=Citrobacter portucalensis TaxID=1639133 RepID=UPI0023B324B4|nr:P-loop NTPase fold protein [Citrobacter portucalensis]MDE9613663.1 KAP family NTPase [Citrobacter portucalensis]
MTTNDESVNKHLRTYLEYYNTLVNPKYAVLVDGEWGVGKTHLINEIFKEKQKIYVSLFGLTTVQEIHSAVFVKMYPNRSRIKRFLNWFGNSSLKANDVTLAIGPLIGNIANALIKENVDNSKPIIFDDLERCRINQKDIFGAINKYVEHHQCKVIVIAHDKKLQKGLTDKKEKIFGQILKVSPDVQDAFNQFVKRSKAPQAFECVKDIIYKSFIASQCKSLRVLDYVINDCARLLPYIPNSLYKDKRLLSELFVLFTAIDINFRLGKLTDKDIELRNSVYYYMKKEEDAKNIFDEIKENYKEHEVYINIDSDLISNEVLSNTIINGLYIKEQIQDCISKSRHFMKPENYGPWFTILSFDSCKTDEVDKALEELYARFKNMQIIEKGEIQHSINVLFLLSDARHIDKSFDEIYSFFLDYVKKLQHNDKFLPADLFTEYEPINDSAYGYGFWINDSYRHYSSTLNKILISNQTIALRKKYPIFLDELKKDLKEDTPKFCQKISRNGMRDINLYGYIAILSGFKPHEFVDMWLSIDMTKWQSIRSALVNRYSGGSLQGDLQDEGSWIKLVKMNVQHRASKESGIDSLRISRLLMGL